MLMNFKEFIDYLDKNIPYWDFIEKGNIKDDFRYIPMKYDYILEKRIGYASVWNDVGCVEMTVSMYKPIGGGTVLYDVD
jgi:hypothetical protein